MIKNIFIQVENIYIAALSHPCFILLIYVKASEHVLWNIIFRGNDIQLEQNNPTYVQSGEEIKVWMVGPSRRPLKRV